MNLTAEILEEFKNYLILEEKSAATLDKYMRDARAFFAFSRECKVTKELVMEYKRKLIDRGYAVQSINSMLASVHSLLSFCGAGDCRVKVMKIQRETYSVPEKELTRTDYFRLLEAAGEKPRLKMLLQTICGTGIRVSELRYFTVEADINIAKLADILGHSSINTTRIYIMSTGMEHRQQLDKINTILLE